MRYLPEAHARAKASKTEEPDAGKPQDKGRDTQTLNDRRVCQATAYA